MKKTILLIFFLASLLGVQAQTQSDYNLAFKYYNEQDYEKAAVLFEKIYKQNGSKAYFTYYMSCLLEIKDFETAEKEVKKQLKKNPDNGTFVIELGYVYKKQGLTEKAEAQFNQAIENIGAQKYNAMEMANIFIQRRDYQLAERTYLKAREKTPDYTFRYELANIYSLDRSFDKMANEYVELLVEDETQIGNVQNRLQYFVTNDIDESFSEILRKATLRKLQQDPNKSILNELLIWLFVQKKNFSAALIQEIAIDKRFDLAGQRVLNLGDLALSNEDYDAALKSYAYIIEIGEKSFFYSKAKISHLNVKFQMLLGDKKTTKGQYQNLENEYLATLNALGQTPKTIPLMIDMAHIQAFYLNKTQHALDLLDYASGLPGVKSEVQAQCFMKMADIQMIMGEIWEATLIYAKVEKDNEQNPIGHEAKYRKARLAFFIGDFKWAQAQLDALKAATTKLIANDAFQLSQLIKDNLADDTITEALQIYARAGLLELQENDSLSLQTIDSIFVKFPANAILDDALLFKADIMHKRKNYDQEAAFLQQIVDNYAYDILADDAFFRLAQLNEFQFKNNAKAMELYKTIITDFPASIYVSEARKRFRELRGDKTT